MVTWLWGSLAPGFEKWGNSINCSLGLHKSTLLLPGETEDTFYVTGVTCNSR